MEADPEFFPVRNYEFNFFIESIWKKTLADEKIVTNCPWVGGSQSPGTVSIDANSTQTGQNLLFRKCIRYSAKKSVFLEYYWNWRITLSFQKHRKNFW